MQRTFRTKYKQKFQFTLKYLLHYFSLAADSKILGNMRQQFFFSEMSIVKNP